MKNGYNEQWDKSLKQNKVLEETGPTPAIHSKYNAINKISSSSSAFNYSGKSSQNGDNVPYWDMLSLDDVREHEKDMTKKREAQKRAQRQLKSCLEGQMRENSIKKHIIKMDQDNNKHEVILDRMKRLEEEHQLKVFLIILQHSAINTWHLLTVKQRDMKIS